MGGGLMQLVAYGAQDVYLTGNPQITFWKVTYRRYTNFAMESIEQTFNGQADFGRRVTCTISRNGDLAYRTYLQVTLPEINQQMNPLGMTNHGAKEGEGVYARWLDFPGEQLISQVEVEIGGQRIDRQYGDWMHIWNQLTMSAEQEKGYHKMIGNTTQLTFITDPLFQPVDGPCTSDAPRQVCQPRNALPETTLYIPLQFWFCRNPGLALPLIALQYHEVRINLDLRPIDECLWAVNKLQNQETANDDDFGGANIGQGNSKHDTAYVSGCGKKVANAYSQSIVAASLYVDYVFLDTDERRRMAQNPHEYLIEQLQFTGDESVGSSSNKIKLNFNHPCKELIWVVQPDENVDYCASFDCTQHLFQVFGAQPFNYTDAIDALPNAIHSFGTKESIVGPGEYGGNGFINDAGLFQQAAPTDLEAQMGLEIFKNLCTATAFSEDSRHQLVVFNALKTMEENCPNDINKEVLFENHLRKDMGRKQWLDLARNASGEKLELEPVRKALLFVLFGLHHQHPNEVDPLYPGVVRLLNLTSHNSHYPTSHNLGANFPGKQVVNDGTGQVVGGGDVLGGWGNAYGAGNLNSYENGQQPVLAGVSDAGTYVLSETSLTMHCWGENPVITAKLQLNGQDRFSEREGTYFDLVQPYQHHTRNPDSGINVYSFALRPEEHQPSGTCNFSRIDNSTLQLILSNATVEGTKTAKVRVYATNYNVLRIMSGMGGLAYSN